MKKAAAKLGDRIVGTADNHTVNVPNSPPATGTHPEKQSFAFNGQIKGSCSESVWINGKNAATVDSFANNEPPHKALPPTTFAKAPENKGTITTGSNKVKINGKNAAFHGSHATTCNDYSETNNSSVEVANVASATVFIGE